MRSSKPFSVKVLGAFDLIDRNGRSIRPPGRKDCALIAILALTRNHRQTRTWLQDKLWSDRGPAQAAASLRQSLTTLRALFNNELEVLATDRTWVWLEANLVDFDHAVYGAKGEILRGLDLREEGFSDWLRQSRQEFSERDLRWGLMEVPAQPDRQWYFELPAYAIGEAGLAGICELVCEGIMEAFSVIGLRAVIRSRGDMDTRPPRATDMVVRTRALRIGPGGILSVSVTDGFGTLKWQVRREIEPKRWYDLRAVEVEIVQMLQDFAARTEAKSLGGARWSAHANGCQALMGILVPGSVPLPEIVKCSEAAIAANEKGVYHAILGFAHLLLHGEREKLTAPDLDEVMESFRTSLRLSPENGLCQALAGHCHGYLLRDLARNASMTREAVRLLPNSGSCWNFHAISLVYCGRYADAVRAASKAVFLSRGTVLQPLTQSTELFARLMAGDTDGAIRAGETSLDAIMFRPTVVDLMTAYVRAGRIKEGRSKLDLLVGREPNLSLGLLRSQDYPIVNPAHRAAVVEAAVQLGLA
jgi:hypothetical protein